MFLYIRKSKTDQAGKGARIAIPEGRRIQPIRRLTDWLRVADIRDGYLFRNMHRGELLRGGGAMHHSNIARIIKHYAALIGLNAGERFL